MRYMKKDGGGSGNRLREFPNRPLRTLPKSLPADTAPELVVNLYPQSRHSSRGGFASFIFIQYRNHLWHK